MRLAERMEELEVPGLSLAVVDDFELDWAKSYGVMDASTGAPVTTDSGFQAASIGRVLVAAAVLELVDQGLADLDADVNTQLESWRVPENEFTSREKVTLRRLLSHSAGVTVSGFRGYGPEGLGEVSSAFRRPSLRTFAYADRTPRASKEKRTAVSTATTPGKPTEHGSGPPPRRPLEGR